MRLDVTSEIGKLKSVLVHLPGREIDVMVPPMMAELLIGGIPNERQESGGELPRFDLSPIPNYFFTRDPQVVLGSGVVVCGMATRARRREALLSKYIFEYHASFRDTCQFKVDFMAG